VVLQKRNNKWLIVLNHTALAQKVPSAAPATRASHRNNPRSRAPDETSRPGGDGDEELEETLEAWPEQHPGNYEKQNPCNDAGSHQGPRELVDFHHKFSLLSGHVFFRRVKEDLIVLVAGQNTPPNEENNKDSGGNAPCNNHVKALSLLAALWFHGDLPLDRSAVPGYGKG